MSDFGVNDRARRLSLAAALGLAACTPAPTPKEAPQADKSTAEAPKPGVDPLDPNSCKSCHGSIFEEWSGSMHALAHQSKDPIFAGLRKIRLKKEGEGIAKACANCHYPRAKDFEGPIATAGLGCTSCHSIKTLHPAPKMGGAAAEFYADNTLLGPHDTKDNPAHKGGPAPSFMTDSQPLCLSCHGEVKNKAKLSACSTGPEHAATEGAKSCVSCHMPQVEGPGVFSSARKTHASHKLFGPRAAWADKSYAMADRGLKLSMTLKRRNLKVSLQNTSGHAFPTGFPGRMVILKLVGLDRAGKPVWTNFEKNPMKESPESVLNKVYVGKDDKPILPPYAVKLKRDSRLKPGETRALSFKVPSKVRTVKAKALFRLVPPPVVKPFGLEGSPLAGMQPIAEASAKR